MSKSLGNYIAIEDTPQDIFGKVMSISDEMMWKYYELLTNTPLEELEALKSGAHPMEAKKSLAFRMVEWFNGAGSAEAAQKDFEVKFSRRDFPEDAREVIIEKGGDTSILDLVMVSSAKIKSKGEAKRLIQQGGVSLDSEKFTDPTALVPERESLEVKLGKKEFVRVRFG